MRNFFFPSSLFVLRTSYFSLPRLLLTARRSDEWRFPKYILVRPYLLPFTQTHSHIIHPNQRMSTHHKISPRRSNTSTRCKITIPSTTAPPPPPSFRHLEDDNPTHHNVPHPPRLRRNRHLRPLRPNLHRHRRPHPRHDPLRGVVEVDHPRGVCAGAAGVGCGGGGVDTAVITFLVPLGKDQEGEGKDLI